MRTPSRALRVAAVAIPAAFTLACGGIWREVVAESFSEMSAQLLVTVPAGPDRDRVMAVLDEGFVQARRGEVGLFEMIRFEDAFEMALLDGQLSPAELDGLEASAAQADFPAVDVSTLPADDVAEREQLLKIKRALDEQMTGDPLIVGFGLADTGVPLADEGRDAPLASFADWTAPEVTRRLKKAGWTLDTCHDETVEGMSWSSCTGTSGARYATVTLSRFPTTDEARWSSQTWDGDATAVRRDGTATLVVTVLDGDRAVTIRDALLPAGQPVSGLEQARIEAHLRGDGWTVEACDASWDADGRGFGCAMMAGDVVGTVDVWVEADASGAVSRETREVGWGSASVDQDQGSLSVEVADGARAEQLIEALLAG